MRHAGVRLAHFGCLDQAQAELDEARRRQRPQVERVLQRPCSSDHFGIPIQNLQQLTVSVTQRYAEAASYWLSILCSHIPNITIVSYASNVLCFLHDVGDYVDLHTD